MLKFLFRKSNLELHTLPLSIHQKPFSDREYFDFLMSCYAIGKNVRMQVVGNMKTLEVVTTLGH